MNSISTKDRHMLEDQASRQKRKISSFIFFTVLFTLIILSIISVFIALKQEADSESLSASNPEQAIKAVCDLTPYPSLCFKPIWSRHRNISTNSNITPSRIFVFSLHAALHQLSNLISANQKAFSKVKDSRTLSALKSCDGLIRDSIRLMNMSVTAMGIEPDDKIFNTANSVRDLKEWATNSTRDLDKCLAGLWDDHEGSKKGKFEFLELKMKIVNAKYYVENSSVILAQMNKILGMFNQPIFAGFIYYNLLSDRMRYDFGMILYGMQYLVLIVLIFMVLRS